MKVKVKEVTQSCLTLWDPMDGSLPGSEVHGIFQARILEWAAISFSRGSSQATQIYNNVGKCCKEKKRMGGIDSQYGEYAVVQGVQKRLHHKVPFD